MLHCLRRACTRPPTTTTTTMRPSFSSSLQLVRLFSSPADPQIKQEIAHTLQFMERHGIGKRRKSQRIRKSKHVKFISVIDELSEQFRQDQGLGKYKPNFSYVGSALQEKDIPPLPEPPIPQIAIAGRSNVGKSSLLKAMAIKGTNLRVKCEDVPGTTQTLDFFDMPNVLRIVDLPGYGFAYADPEKQKQWRLLTDLFLIGAAGKAKHRVKRVFLLLDARHQAKQSDHEMLDMLALHRVGFHVVFTKTDLVPPVELAKRFVELRLLLASKYGYTMTPQHMHMVSSHTGAGIMQLWQSIRSLLPPPPVKPRTLMRKQRKTEEKKKKRKQQAQQHLDGAAKVTQQQQQQPSPREVRLNKKRESLLTDKERRRVRLMEKVRRQRAGESAAAASAKN